MAFEEKLSIPDVHDAGLDWLTMTWKIGEENYEVAKENLENFGQSLNSAGCDTKFTGWQGYTGWQFGKIFLGQRPDGIIIRATGDHAKIAEAYIKEKNCAGKCTRCDLQITAKDRAAEPDYGSRVRKEIESFAASDQRAARRSFACYKSLGRDSGCVVGSRSSSRYFRFYNKTLEQRNRIEAGLWRYEVEFKGDQARYLWKMTQRSSRSYWLAQSVVKSEFEALGADMSFVTQGEKYERQSTYHQTNEERQLRWLATDVRGVVIKLLEAGKRAEVLEALGLTGEERLF